MIIHKNYQKNYQPKLKILYDLDTTLNKQIDRGNAKIISNLPKIITFEESLEVSFDLSYLELEKVRNKFIQFLDDFSKSEKFELLYLDATGKEFRTIWDKKISRTLKNYVLIAWNKSPKAEWNNNNAAAIFFDIECLFSEKNNRKDTIKFNFSRVELLNLDYINESNPITSVSFEKVESKELCRMGDINYKDVYDILTNTNKLINIFNQDSKFSLQWDAWRDFIDVVIGKDSNIDYRSQSLMIWTAKQLSFKNLDNSTLKEVILFSRSKHHSFDKKELNLTSPINDNDVYKLKISNLKEFNIDYHLKKLKDECETKCNQFLEKVKQNKGNISKLQEEQNEIIENINELKNKINPYESKLNEIEKANTYLSNKISCIDKICKEILNSHNIKQKELLDLYNKMYDDCYSLGFTVNNNLLKVENDKEIGNKSLKNELLVIFEKIKNSNNEKLKKNENDLQPILKEKDAIEKRIENFNNEINQRSITISELESDNLNNKKNIKELENEIAYFEKLIETKNENKIEYSWICDLKLITNDGDSDQFNFVIDKTQTFENFEENTWCLSDFDVGLMSKFKRYNFAIKNANEGYYRNPYMIYSLIKTPVIKNITHIDEVIKNKYKLNGNQIKAVEKAISTRDLFYLQGPPGTGKTQTICCITESVIKKNKNILMTSGTHEAINNYFDRLDYENSADPNMIIWKYTYIEDQNNNKHSTYTIYSKFIDRIKAYVNSNVNKSLKNVIDRLEKIVNQFNCFEYFYHGKAHFDYLKSHLNDHDLDDNKNKLLLELKKQSERRKRYALTSNQDEIKLDDLPLTSKNLEFETSVTSDEKILNELEEIFDWLYINNIEIFYNNFSELLENLKRMDINNNQNDEFIKTFNKYFDNHKDLNSEIGSNFLNYVFDNNLINVIGITTTARTTIQIGNKTKDLFSEYPIEMVIIDEISKSSTPEILSRIILAKKAICCGDYRQLPPVSDIDNSSIEKFFNPKKLKQELIDDYLKPNISSELYNSLINSKNKDDKGSEENSSLTNNENDEYINAVRKWIDNLYKTSFFTNQVEKAKTTISSSNSKSVYQHLDMQFRFNQEIMDVVNIFYDSSEKLKLPTNYKPLPTTNISIKNDDGIIIKNNVVLCDTTFLNPIFKQNNIYSKICNISRENYAFDQKEIIDTNIAKIKSNGRINEYNAWTVLNIINSIVESAKQEKVDIINKIGVICLTINQKHIIRSMLNKYHSHLNPLKIKIDTIDNFQGREKDIIIVDFVCARDVFENGTIIKRTRNLDFIDSENRINVAFSRARSKLYIVGAFDYYINYEKNNAIKRVSKDLIKIINQGD